MYNRRAASMSQVCAQLLSFCGRYDICILPNPIRSTTELYNLSKYYAL